MEKMKDLITYKGKLFHYVISFGNSRIYGRGKKRLMVDQEGEVKRTYNKDQKGSLSSLLRKA